jgi:hypothetical protein
LKSILNGGDKNVKNYGDLPTPSFLRQDWGVADGEDQNACTNGQIEKYDGPMITVAVTN